MQHKLLCTVTHPLMCTMTPLHPTRQMMPFLTLSAHAIWFLAASGDRLVFVHVLCIQPLKSNEELGDQTRMLGKVMRTDRML